MSEKTPGQVAYEASEAAEWNVASDPWDSDWHQLSESSQQEWEAIAQAVLAAQWQPIETAPNGVAILVAYDDGCVDGISAEGNDYEWEAYDGRPEIGLSKPTHWMPAPKAPIDENKE